MKFNSFHPRRSLKNIVVIVWQWNLLNNQIERWSTWNAKLNCICLIQLLFVPYTCINTHVLIKLLLGFWICQKSYRLWKYQSRSIRWQNILLYNLTRTKSGPEYKDCCMLRYIFIIKHLSNYWPLHRSDLATSARDLEIKITV